MTHMYVCTSQLALNKLEFISQPKTYISQLVFKFGPKQYSQVGLA